MKNVYAGRVSWIHAVEAGPLPVRICYKKQRESDQH